MKSELRRLERQIEALLEFQRFQQMRNNERDAREFASYQASLLAALGAPKAIRPTRPPTQRPSDPATQRPRAPSLPDPPRPRSRPIDDLLLDRLRLPPPGRPANLHAIPVMPTPRVRPPTRTRLPPAPMVGSVSRVPPQPRPSDDLLLDRSRLPPPGRPVNLRGIPVLPTPKVRPPTRTRPSPAPIVSR